MDHLKIIRKFNYLKVLLVLLAISFLFALPITSKSEEFGIQFGGYIRNDLFYDTRTNEGVRDNMLVFYPKNIELNSDGEDINAKPSLYWSNLATRINAKITTPDFLKAKVIGLIEAEFVGQVDAQTNVMRLRHAYIDLDWGISKLTIGQTWNPMFVVETMPMNLALTAGAPITPLVRNPQIKYQHRFTKDFYASITALSQRDFTSPGPNGFSTEYQRYAVIPALNLQLKYKSSDGNLVFGAGAEYKTLRPYGEFEVTNSNGVRDKFITTTNVTSIAANAFFGITAEPINIRIGAWYGGNMADFLMAGGYGVSEYAADGTPSKYTTFNNASGMVDISASLSKTTKIGVFAAANKNLGTTDELRVSNPYWARAKDIDMLYRISPRITYQIHKLQFGLEYEYTGAIYGKTREFVDENKTIWQGKWAETTNVNNSRILLATTLFF